MIDKIKNIFSDLKSQLIHDYKNDKLIFFLESVGTIFSIIASVTLATLGKDANLLLVFSSYLIGSSSWVAAGMIRNNSFLIVLNINFTIINIIGLINTVF